MFCISLCARQNGVNAPTQQENWNVNASLVPTSQQKDVNDKTPI